MTTYLISDASGYTKIGKSKDPSKRIRTLLCGNPTARLLLLLNGDFEKTLHQKFSNFRVTGEWFNLSPLQISEIAENFSVKIDNRNSIFRYESINLARDTK